MWYLIPIRTVLMIRDIAILVLFVNVSCVRSEDGENNIARYTNLWAVKLSKKDDGVLEKLRMLEGFEIVQQVLWAEQIYFKRIHLKSMVCPGKSVFGPSYYKKLFNDRYFSSQWYLQDCRKSDSSTQYDLGVVSVWHHYKYFGYGIKVVVIDGAVRVGHPDLKTNFDPEYGYDFITNVPSPKPKGFLNVAKHGTITAGIIAMEANNKICGVGIAPLVTLGALRVSHTIYQEAAALSFRAEDLDVSNNSWGQPDDGKYVNELPQIVMDALKRGITVGRRSKGLIFVFPSGNGKRAGDTCAHDAYPSSMYTITVAGVKHNGSVTFYSESCSNVLVTAYSGDGMYIPGTGIVSTTMWNDCQDYFAGTSAAVPVVSGIVALILESNSNLCWRQVQHIFVWTNEVAPLAHNKTWFRNKAGFYFSPDFGFGLADAFQAVKFAKTMRPIPPMNSCVLSAKRVIDGEFDRKSALRIKISTNGCKNLPSEVNYMEHVQLVASVEHLRRGAIEILLISPSGTKTNLMESRRLDKSRRGLRRQILDTVQLWGEAPQGEWSIIFYDTVSTSGHPGFVTRVHLLIHGTKDRPPHYTATRTYKKFNL